MGYEEGGSSPRPCGASRSQWCSSTRSRRPTPTCSALLQILEEGRLTDSQGRSVDFRNTVLIMTSTSARRISARPRWASPATTRRCPTRR
ncbi:MAG: AAA family ATPase [Microthrixaceae bacterium]